MAHPVYVLPRTPGATETTEWDTFCQSRKPFVVIDHQAYRLVSRWTHANRKRPFRVTRWTHGRFGLVSLMSYHLTLAHARRAAAQLAKGDN